MTVSMNVSTNQKDNALSSMLMGQSNAESSAFDAELNQQMQSTRQDLAEATHGYDDFQQQQQDLQTQARHKTTLLREDAIQREQTQAQTLQDERMVTQLTDDHVEPQLNQTSAVEELNVDATDAVFEDLPELTASQSDLLLSMIEKSNALQPRVLEVSNHTAAVSLTAETAEASERIDAIPAIFTKPLLEKPTTPSDPRPVETSATASDDQLKESDEPMFDDLALDAASYWRLKQQDSAVQVKSNLTEQLEAARQKASEQADAATKTRAEPSDGSSLNADTEPLKADKTSKLALMTEEPVPPKVAVTREQDDTIDTEPGQVQGPVAPHANKSELAPSITTASAEQAQPSSAQRSQSELKLKLRGEPLLTPEKEQRLVDTAAPVDSQPPVTSLLQHEQLHQDAAEQSHAQAQETPRVTVANELPNQPDAATTVSASIQNTTSTSSAGAATSVSSATETVTRADGKPTFAEFMQNSNQQEQQSASNPQPKAELQTATGENVTQPRHDAPVTSVDMSTSRQPTPVVESAANSSTPGVAPASTHAVHTHVNKLTDTLKAAEMTAQQQSLDLQQPTAASKLLERVMYQVQQKIQSAEVQLHPEDLGAMQIKLSLQQDQVTVQFLVQNGSAKDAVEQQLPRLKDMLQQQGMQLAEGQVEQRQQGQQGDSSQRQSNRSTSELTGDTEQAGVVQQGQVKVRISERAVDYYA